MNVLFNISCIIHYLSLARVAHINAKCHLSSSLSYLSSSLPLSVACPFHIWSMMFRWQYWHKRRYQVLHHHLCRCSASLSPISGTQTFWFVLTFHISLTLADYHIAQTIASTTVHNLKDAIKGAPSPNECKNKCPNECKKKWAYGQKNRGGMCHTFCVCNFFTLTAGRRTPAHSRTFAHIHAYSCTFTHRRTNVHAHTDTHVNKCTHTHTRTLSHTHTHMHTNTHAYTHTHAHTRTRTCTHTHTHTKHFLSHTHTTIPARTHEYI